MARRPIGNDPPGLHRLSGNCPSAGQQKFQDVPDRAIDFTAIRIEKTGMWRSASTGSPRRAWFKQSMGNNQPSWRAVDSEFNGLLSSICPKQTMAI
jgi:hypothetical protein